MRLRLDHYKRKCGALERYFYGELSYKVFKGTSLFLNIHARKENKLFSRNHIFSGLLESMKAISVVQLWWIVENQSFFLLAFIPIMLFGMASKLFLCFCDCCLLLSKRRALNFQYPLP